MADISPKLRFKVLRRDNFTCRYCGAKAPDVRLQVDHVHPRSRGGGDRIANLVTACRECNIGKRDNLLQPLHCAPDRVGPILYRLLEYQRKVRPISTVVQRLSSECLTIEEYIDRLDDYRADLDWVAAHTPGFGFGSEATIS